MVMNDPCERIDFSYDENSREGRDQEEMIGSQNEPSSQPITDSKWSLISIECLCLIFKVLIMRTLLMKKMMEHSRLFLCINFFSIHSKISFQGVPLTEITNIWQYPPSLTDMKDVQDRNHTFLIKVSREKLHSSFIDWFYLAISKWSESWTCSFLWQWNLCRWMGFQLCSFTLFAILCHSRIDIILCRWRMCTFFS